MSVSYHNISSPLSPTHMSTPAPEILAYEPISLAADIWSLGVTAYALLTGFSPFGGETDQETLRNIASAALDFPAELFEGVSDEAKEFITACLHRNPRLVSSQSAVSPIICNKLHYI